MARKLLCVILLFTTVFMYAKKNYTIKLYNQSSFSKSNDSYKFYYINDSLKSKAFQRSTVIFHPTVALNWTNKKNKVRELELTHFNFSTTDEYDPYLLGPVQYKSKLLHIALRYEAIFSFIRKKDTRIKAQLGVAIAPFFKYQQYIPQFSSLFPSSEMKFGFKHFAVPRCLIRISHGWSADINIPILVAKAQYNSNVYLNPALPPDKQKYSIFDFDMLEKEYQLRLGLCYNL